MITDEQLLEVIRYTIGGKEVLPPGQPIWVVSIVEMAREILALRESNTIQAQRDENNAKRAQVIYAGCDTTEVMADTILGLRKALAEKSRGCTFHEAFGGEYWTCSSCGKMLVFEYPKDEDGAKYCPNCGAMITGWVDWVSEE